MFKSIFAKYVGAIMAIVLLSFLVLATVMTALVSRYSMREKETLIQTTAENTAESIYAYKRLANTDLFHSEAYRQEVQRMIDRNAKNADSVIFLTTLDGTITLYSANAGASDLKLDAVPKDVMDALYLDSEAYMNSDLGGVFEKPHTNYFYQIVTENEDGERVVIAALFISTLSTRGTGVVQYMSGTLLISMLWVTIAALSATYLISNRITQPLKSISRAAKEFGTGNFNVRVPVTGSDEVAELSETFNTMAETLSQQEKLRNTFIGNVSHDLRTPMTTISGFIDGILDGAIPPEQQSHYLSLIGSEV
ncbi:MAG: HAMP domain-containing protein, partial [Clostridia bacterium]|nr:HAMP domain-containing protein [Clostridia bacterium]